MNQIYCGGNPEGHFERLGVEARKAYEGAHPYSDERITVFELEDPAFKRLLLDAAEDMWTPTESWWRECGGSNLGSYNATVEVAGQSLLGWMREDEDFDPDDDDPPYIPQRSWGHVFEYLCEEVGASTERNVAAVLTDLAAWNDLSVGELLARTNPLPTDSDPEPEEPER